MQTVKNATRAGTLTTYRSIPDGLKISDGSRTYEVKFDGKDYPAGGDSHATTSLKCVDESTIEEIDKEEGKVVVVTRMAVSKDGKTHESRIRRQAAGFDDDLYRGKATVHLPHETLRLPRL